MCRQGYQSGAAWGWYLKLVFPIAAGALRSCVTADAGAGLIRAHVHVCVQMLLILSTGLFPAGPGNRTNDLSVPNLFSNLLVLILLQRFAAVFFFIPVGISPSLTLSLTDTCTIRFSVFVCPQHGACVNAMDLWQFTPLHEAASKNRVEVCSLLLSHGADPTLVNCHGKSAVDMAPTPELKERLTCKRLTLLLLLLVLLHWIISFCKTQTNACLFSLFLRWIVRHGLKYSSYYIFKKKTA